MLWREQGFDGADPGDGSVPSKGQHDLADMVAGFHAGVRGGASASGKVDRSPA